MKQPLEQKIYSLAVKIPLILGALIILIYPAGYKFALGIVFGGLLGALAFRLLTLDVYKITSLPVAQVKKQALRNYFKRWLMYAATLIVAITSPYISFLAAVLGLLIPKFIAIIYVFSQRGD